MGTKTEPRTGRVDLLMQDSFLFQHLFHFEGSQAAGQQLLKVNVDDFGVFVPKAVRLGTQMLEERPGLGFHLNPQRL